MCPPPAPKAGGTHSLGAEGGGGVNSSEDARHWIVLLQYNPSTNCILKAWLYSVQSEQRDRTAGGRVPEQQALGRREARQGGRRCRRGILQAGHCRFKGAVS